VHWGVAGRLAVAWLITLPAAGAIGGGTSWVADAIGGTAGVVVMAVVGAILAAGLWAATRNDRVTADNVLDPLPTYTDSDVSRLEVGELVPA
jgi:inorganic phosphate transporter, PiT family